jgi:hypothetical protein
MEDFEVLVTNPSIPEEEGGLKKGARLHVRGILHDHRIGGPFIVFFLVYNEKKQNFMLEPASQFTPIVV